MAQVKSSAQTKIDNKAAIDANGDLVNGLSAYNGKAVRLPDDRNLQSWAMGSPASGLYEVLVTVQQNGLPVGTGYYFVEIIRKSDDVFGNQNSIMTATEVYGGSVAIPNSYVCRQIQTGALGWAKINETLTHNFTAVAPTGKTFNLTYTNGAELRKVAVQGTPSVNAGPIVLSAYITVNSVTQLVSAATSDNNGAWASHGYVYFEVPPFSSYMVSVSNPSINLLHWTETI